MKRLGFVFRDLMEGRFSDVFGFRIRIIVASQNEPGSVPASSVFWRILEVLVLVLLNV